MCKAFDLLSESLNDAILDTQTNHLPRHKRKIDIEPITTYSSDEIRDIRNQLGLTQKLFAQYFGVSKKTIEAWESGKNKPSGPSRRLLGLIANKKISI
ncbi:helix-turn-helix domain-containing protein [uncultured Megasphaera sp.]|uniref:helix-turn-helix domain-containing protein n=1 Tax=uncultured Megasphaera sp. TaxID=165188 RepID=UPI0025D733CC|nr:helix-turn-helix domain-containing protein [uncultured Megasphaera sp.]